MTGLLAIFANRRAVLMAGAAISVLGMSQGANALPASSYACTFFIGSTQVGNFAGEDCFSSGTTFALLGDGSAARQTSVNTTLALSSSLVQFYLNPANDRLVTAAVSAPSTPTTTPDTGTSGSSGSGSSGSGSSGSGSTGTGSSGSGTSGPDMALGGGGTPTTNTGDPAFPGGEPTGEDVYNGNNNAGLQPGGADGGFTGDGGAGGALAGAESDLPVDGAGNTGPSVPPGDVTDATGPVTESFDYPGGDTPGDGQFDPVNDVVEDNSPPRPLPTGKEPTDLETPDGRQLAQEGRDAAHNGTTAVHEEARWYDRVLFNGLSQAGLDPNAVVAVRQHETQWQPNGEGPTYLDKNEGGFTASFGVDKDGKVVPPGAPFRYIVTVDVAHINHRSDDGERARDEHIVHVSVNAPEDGTRDPYHPTSPQFLVTSTESSQGTTSADNLEPNGTWNGRSNGDQSADIRDALKQVFGEDGALRPEVLNDARAINGGAH